MHSGPFSSPSINAINFFPIGSMHILSEDCSNNFENFPYFQSSTVMCIFKLYLIIKYTQFNYRYFWFKKKNFLTLPNTRFSFAFIVTYRALSTESLDTKLILIWSNIIWSIFSVELQSVKLCMTMTYSPWNSIIIITLSIHRLNKLYCINSKTHKSRLRRFIVVKYYIFA